MPKLGSVYWMRDERKGAWVTVPSVLPFSSSRHWWLSDYRGSRRGNVCIGAFQWLSAKAAVAAAHAGAPQKFAEDLESGQAHVITCRPTRIIEREEFEDEGALWIFDGGEGRYLVISGQEYYETPRFPSSHFDVVMGARHGLVIGIRSHGLRIPSTLPVTGDDIPWDNFPNSDITVFSAPPNAELPIILRHLEKSTAA